MDLHVALPPLVKSEDNAIRRMMRTGPSQSETPATQEHSHVIVVTAPRESGGQLHIPRRPAISCVRSSDFDSSLGRRTRELRQIDQVSKFVLDCIYRFGAPWMNRTTARSTLPRLLWRFPL